jgi:hypothetical protein
MSAVAHKLGKIGNLEGELMVLSEANAHLISTELLHGNSWLMDNNVTKMIRQLAVT